MARKKDNPQGAPDWMVTYGDMMTLLLCFFVILVSMSELRQETRFKKVMESIRQAFGYKGGIGTSSRVLPKALGGYTVGVLVQTNFGGTLTVNGAPVGREFGDYAYHDELEARPGGEDAEDGSIMIVVATDAPLMPRGLGRLAMRAMLGLARTGSFAHNGSGDYVIAFSTDPSARRPRTSSAPVETRSLVNESLSPLFAATAEATEEAIYNALLKATTVRSARGELRAIPLKPLLEILNKYRVLGWDRSLPPGDD